MSSNAITNPVVENISDIKGVYAPTGTFEGKPWEVLMVEGEVLFSDLYSGSKKMDDPNNNSYYVTLELNTKQFNELKRFRTDTNRELCGLGTSKETMMENGEIVYDDDSGEPKKVITERKITFKQNAFIKGELTSVDVIDLKGRPVNTWLGRGTKVIMSGQVYEILKGGTKPAINFNLKKVIVVDLVQKDVSVDLDSLEGKSSGGGYVDPFEKFGLGTTKEAPQEGTPSDPDNDVDFDDDIPFD